MRTKFSALILLLPLIAASAGVGFGADLFSGTWQVNVAKSSYRPFPPPKHPAQMRIEAIDEGITVINDAVSDSGQRYHEEWALRFDGRDYPVEVSYDGRPQEGVTISGKKVNEHTIEITMKSNGQIDSTSKWSVKGGKTLTVIGKSNGKTTGPMVFDKKSTR